MELLDAAAAGEPVAFASIRTSCTERRSRLRRDFASLAPLLYDSKFDLANK